MAAMDDAVCTIFPQVTSRKSAYPCSYAGYASSASIHRSAWKVTSLKSVTIGSKQSHGHLLIQRRIPSERPSHNVGYPGSGSVFEDVSGSTRLEGVRETRKYVDGSEDEHERVRKFPLYGVGSCDPIHLGHPEAQQHQLGTQAAAKRYSFLAYRLSSAKEGQRRIVSSWPARSPSRPSRPTPC
jgi:hypothetical protein